MVKRCSIYIYIWLKKILVFGCFRIEEIHDKFNATGLKEEGLIVMSNAVLSIYAIALALFAFVLTYLSLE